MHEMLCFAVQNVSRKMDGEACPADGFETVPVMLGSWSGRPRIGTASSGVVLPTFLRVVLLCVATQSLRIALEWLRQGCLAPGLRA